MSKIEIEIGGDNKDLERKIAEAEVLLKNLRKDAATEFKAGNIDLAEKMQVEVNEAKKSLKGLQTEYGNTTKSTNTLTKATGNGGNTLMQFSRIAQDAPFGIMGIGNNITATAESFSYLSKSSGGAGNALKAVASSMLGTGGILLAVSLVTSALTYMSQKGITVGDVFSKLTGDFDRVGNAMKIAFDEASKSAVEETNNLRGLIAVAQSETVSREARTQAVNNLQSKYPAYFGNLSKEEIMYGNLKNVLDDLTKALINKAIAEKLSKDAVDPTIALWKANARLVKEKEQIVRLEKSLAEAQKTTNNQEFLAFFTKDLATAKDNANSTRSEIISLTKDLTGLNNALNIASQSAAQLLIKPNKTVKQKTVQDVKTNLNITPQVKPLANSLIPAGLTSQVGAKLMAEIPVIKQAREAISAELMMFNKSASAIISGNIADTFGQLGMAIGDSLANGGNVLKAAGSALLAGLGSVMIELGKMAIATGVGILGVKLALKTLNPAVAIAGGVALVALGSVFASKAGALIGSRGGSGGNTQTNSGGNSYSNSGVSSSGFSSSSNGGNVVFEISGQSLIGVLSNTLDRNRRIGGALGIG